jgi:hypothetical protein
MKKKNKKSMILSYQKRFQLYNIVNPQSCGILARKGKLLYLCEEREMKHIGKDSKQRWGELVSSNTFS